MWLKTIEIYSLIVLEVRSLKSRCQQGRTPSKGCREEFDFGCSSFCVFWKSLAFFGLWRRKWHPTPVFLPGESQGWRSLVGCRLWGRTESDTTERLSSSSSQRSCLENPRDGGAWWAAVHGVAQSWTRLKRLSRSSGRETSGGCPEGMCLSRKTRA